MALSPRIYYFAKALSCIPNVPFLHHATVKSLINLLTEMGISQIKNINETTGDGFLCDEFALYVRIRRGNPTHKFLIDSHLDHPGFLLDNNGNGLVLGSVGLNRIKNLLLESPIDIRIFNKDGDFVSLGKITNLVIDGKPNVNVLSSKPVPNNSHGIFDVDSLRLDKENIYMYSADNTIMSAIMLALIEEIYLSSSQYADIDVIFAFTYLEEIFQISATAIASRLRTPFGKLEEERIIVVLEAMESLPLVEHDNLYATLSLEHPNSDDGILIKVNDRDCVYGYEFADQHNLAEAAMLIAAEKLGLQYQHTISSGVSNATSYSVFPTTSHIATLAIPNPYKHNHDHLGCVVPEKIKIRDVEAAVSLLRETIKTASENRIMPSSKSLSVKLKRSDLLPNSRKNRWMKAERSTILSSAWIRLKAGRYFSEGLLEGIVFNLRGGLGRVRELIFQKTIPRT